MNDTVRILKPPEPNRDMIEFLELALEEARSGEVTGILLLKQRREGGATYTVAGIKDRFTVLGFLSHAAFRLQTDD